MWDELTVAEHIKIWNDIKYSQGDRSELRELTEACDLTSKVSARSETLSGGQKRKLQLACMFVGGSSVCLLDEVSSGLVSFSTAYYSCNADELGSSLSEENLEHRFG